MVYSCFNQETQLLTQRRCFMFPCSKELDLLKTFFSFNAIINAVPGRPTNQDKFMQPLREDDS